MGTISIIKVSNFKYIKPSCADGSIFADNAQNHLILELDTSVIFSLVKYLMLILYKFLQADSRDLFFSLVRIYQDFCTWKTTYTHIESKPLEYKSYIS